MVNAPVVHQDSWHQVLGEWPAHGLTGTFRQLPYTFSEFATLSAVVAVRLSRVRVPHMGGREVGHRNAFESVSAFPSTN